MIQNFDSLYDMMEAFPDEQTCIDHLRSIRWKEGAYCPHCGSTKVYHFSDNKTHKCGDCRKRFSIKVGTIFEDSKIALRKWFVAIYLITSHKKGIASTQLAKDIKVTQKTAWFMLQRLRHASQTRSFNQPLSGCVEIDETYVGGKESNKHKNKKKKGTQGRSTKTKTAVIGMVERGGKLQAKSVNKVDSRSIMPIITDNVEPGTNVMTDEFKCYRNLPDGYNHRYITHSVGEYVNGDIHTNTIEGAWSLFKRGVIGIHHHISRKHLDKYLGDFTYRYNTRHLGEGERVNDFLSGCGGRLTYRKLVS